MERLSVKYFLEKLSNPGWIKQYNTTEELSEELKMCLCEECFYELYCRRIFNLTVKDLLSTCCGSEYTVETFRNNVDD